MCVSWLAICDSFWCLPYADLTPAPVCHVIQWQPEYLVSFLTSLPFCYLRFSSPFACCLERVQRTSWQHICGPDRGVWCHAAVAKTMHDKSYGLCWMLLSAACSLSHSAWPYWLSALAYELDSSCQCSLTGTSFFSRRAATDKFSVSSDQDLMYDVSSRMPHTVDCDWNPATCGLVPQRQTSVCPQSLHVHMTYKPTAADQQSQRD